MEPSRDSPAAWGSSSGRSCGCSPSAWDSWLCGGGQSSAVDWGPAGWGGCGEAEGTNRLGELAP